MSNIETVIETLKGLFEGQTYTEEERSRIAGYVKNTLEVPGTIWSLEDFESEASEELTDEERDKVCREAYNSKSNDLHESDWDGIRSALEDPTERIMDARTTSDEVRDGGEEPLTIGLLLSILLSIPEDKHHLPVLVNTDQNYNLQAHYASRYDLDEPHSKTNPFIIEHVGE